MSTGVYVFGIDPGFASIGYSIVQLFTDNEEVIEAGVIRTKKSAEKRNVLASDDNVRRAREIYTELAALILDRNWRIAAICAESMSYPRNSSAAAKMAMCWGLLAAISQQHNIPVVQASPQEVKKAVCRSGSASKEEVEAALRTRYQALDAKVSSVPASLHEHCFDSIASVVACLNSDVVRMARRMAA